MGVPKFFRFISERYPCLSEVVKEYQIPQFDNLYLDMNGIIHACSHPDDGNVHFRITEEKIFQDIFHYIEILFRMIKPQKLFFMAVDGVAPRAKMNQQRGRRFRTAKDAEEQEAKAISRGEKLPSESRFDSNCITPGTEFMAKLQEQLKYFVHLKMSTDDMWKMCKIILSGHETPGEGEHKIMDYIRYLRAQPGYDPNTRHCLYGLDADLIMLGMCTHEPHFSLLREEVKFGRKSKRKTPSADQLTFYLLHLSLMREYLELEFYSVKESLSFEYDIDKIIDDWVLMGFLVGNDFIPNLPNLHIAKGALPILYEAYKKVLPTLDGYINETGTLNLSRFEKFMVALATNDYQAFQEESADLKYFEGKKTGQGWRPKGKEDVKTDEASGGQNNAPVDPELEMMIKNTEEMFLDSDKEDHEAKNNVYSDESSDDSEDLNAEFLAHKMDYYMTKLDYSKVTPEVLRSQAEGYVRAIQWNLHYYYNGVCSWSWFYPHHYAPYISDIKDFSHLKLDYEMGKPFKPFEQLLAVLPAASKNLLPLAFQELMVSEKSPIIGYYPKKFQTDLNGKQQDWEAVVLIPFIAEDMLLEAMAPHYSSLTPEEHKRNTHGPMLIYEYSEEVLGEYEAPGYFPKITENHAIMTTMSVEEIKVPIEKLVKGPYPGVKTGVYYPGFPTFKHLKYTGALKKTGVKVFEMPSRQESMIVTIQDNSKEHLVSLASELLGRTVYVEWPHMIEGRVVTVSNAETYYRWLAGSPGQYTVEDNKGNMLSLWKNQKETVTARYMSHRGIDVGDVEVVVHVETMVGRKYFFSGGGRVTLEKQWAMAESVYPIQAVVRNLSVHDDLHSTFLSLKEVFPVSSKCFMIGQPHYGYAATVVDNDLDKGRIRVRIRVTNEPDFVSIVKFACALRYMPALLAAQKLAVSPVLLSRLTGSIFVSANKKPSGGSQVNVGLNLKFTKRNEEIPGYTKKVNGQWLYSEKAVKLLNEYITNHSNFIAHISQDCKRDCYYEEDIFPDGNGKEELQKIADWVKNQPHSSIDRQVCGSEILDPDVVHMIEESVEKYKESVVSKHVTMQVKPHLLFKPEVTNTCNLVADPVASFKLYDRVVNVRISHTVPFGLKGTIIGIQKPAHSDRDVDLTYLVLFDEEFAGGLSLNCSAGRGYAVSKPALINISYGIRNYQAKTGIPGKLQEELLKNKKPINPPNFINPVQQGQFSNNKASSSMQNSNSARSTKPVQPSVNMHPSQNPHAMPPFPQNWQNVAGPPVLYGRPVPPNYPYYPYQGPPNMPNSFMPYPNPNKYPSNSEFGAFFNDMKKNPAHNPPVPVQPPLHVPPRTAMNFAEPPFFQQPQQQQQHVRMAPPPVAVAKYSISDSAVKKSDATNNETETLKKLLRLDSSPTVKQDGKTQNDNFTQNVQQPSAFVHSSPACTQLMGICQTRGFGIPRYAYFSGPNGQIRANVTLPGGKVCVGLPASDKEQACENAAAVLLEELNRMQEFNIPHPVNPDGRFPMPPVPPQQWCQAPPNQVPPKLSPKKMNVAAAPVKQSKEKSFVPLQAVKQQRNRALQSERPGNDAKKGSIRSQDNSEREPQKDLKANSETSKKPKVKRSRIAANFGALKKQ